MNDITIVRAINTCNAVPSQWDSWDSEGRYWYLRYRFGHGTAEHFEEGPTWYEKQQPGDPIPRAKESHEFLYGSSLDGSIDLEGFCHQIGFKLVLGGWASPEDPREPSDQGLTITGRSSLDEMDEDKPRRRKNRGLALILSALIPGLGSAYAGSYATAARSFVLYAVSLSAALRTGDGFAIFLFAFLWFDSLFQTDEDMFYYTNGYRDVRSYVRGFTQGSLGRTVIDMYERNKGNRWSQ
jgi:hypothetical protein